LLAYQQFPGSSAKRHFGSLVKARHMFTNFLAPLVQIKDRLLVQGVTAEAIWDKLMISSRSFLSIQAVDLTSFV